MVTDTIAALFDGLHPGSGRMVFGTERLLSESQLSGWMQLSGGSFWETLLNMRWEDGVGQTKVLAQGSLWRRLRSCGSKWRAHRNWRKPTCYGHICSTTLVGDEMRQGKVQTRFPSKYCGKEYTQSSHLIIWFTHEPSASVCKATIGRRWTITRERMWGSGQQRAMPASILWAALASKPRSPNFKHGTLKT